MIQRMLASAVFAGFAAGLLAALLHFAFIQKLILLGEQYESGALVHFENAAADKPAGHSHDATATITDPATATTEPATEEHAHGSAAPAPDLSRNALTVLFTCLTYVSYGMLLVAGFALASHFGIRITAREGALWGIAGFVSFQLAPAMGLAPELPGTIAAELSARQIWWLGTVLATGTGIALLAYGRGFFPALVAGVLLAAPHVIGAPQPDQFWGTAPPEVGAAFAANVLGVGLAAWATLGWLAGQFWSSDTA